MAYTQVTGCVAGFILATIAFSRARADVFHFEPTAASVETIRAVGGAIPSAPSLIRDVAIVPLSGPEMTLPTACEGNPLACPPHDFKVNLGSSRLSLTINQTSYDLFQQNKSRFQVVFYLVFGNDTPYPAPPLDQSPRNDTNQGVLLRGTNLLIAPPDPGGGGGGIAFSPEADGEATERELFTETGVVEESIVDNGSGQLISEEIRMRSDVLRADFVLEDIGQAAVISEITFRFALAPDIQNLQGIDMSQALLYVLVKQNTHGLAVSSFDYGVRFVPEPSSLALLVVAGCVVTARRRAQHGPEGRR